MEFSAAAVLNSASPSDTNKFEDGDGPPLVEAFNNVLKDLIRVKAEASGKPWPEFVFAAGDKLITARDLQDVDQRVLASGHRYACSAVISRHQFCGSSPSRGANPSH